MRYHRWTEADIETLRRMTFEGATAQEIADEVGSTAGTVAMMRQRYKVYVSSGACLACGKELAAKARGRRPQFCDDTCQNDYRRGNRQKARADERVGLTCEECGVEMDAESLRRRYCSRRCSQQAWYRRAMDTDAGFVERRRSAARKYQAKKRAAES